MPMAHRLELTEFLKNNLKNNSFFPQWLKQ